MGGGREVGGGGVCWTDGPGIAERFACEMDVAGAGPRGFGGDSRRLIQVVKDCWIRRKGEVRWVGGGVGEVPADGGAAAGRVVRVKPPKFQRGWVREMARFLASVMLW